MVRNERWGIGGKEGRWEPAGNVDLRTEYMLYAEDNYGGSLLFILDIPWGFLGREGKAVVYSCEIKNMRRRE